MSAGKKSKLAKISPGPEECKGCHCFTPARVLLIIRLVYGGNALRIVQYRKAGHAATTCRTTRI